MASVTKRFLQGLQWLLWSEDCSSVPSSPSQGLFMCPDLIYIFYGFTRSFIARTPSPDLLWIDVLHQVFYSQKLFIRSTIETRTSPGLTKQPSTGFNMWAEDIQQIFYIRYRYSMARTPFPGLLIWPEGLQQIFYVYKSVKRSSYIYIEPSADLLCLEVLHQVYLDLL